MDLLKALLIVSEKAANVARACRQDEHLFKLLVQKKKSEESNPRFVEDFKTLADVLIQEMVKHDLSVTFKELANNIKGEENNAFSNKLGEKVYVEIMSSQDETSTLLQKVLNGDQIAADRLANEVHKKIDIKDVKTHLPSEDFSVDLEELGVWIDPIDCTAEYINGGLGKTDKNIDINGLNCVTILIGVFNKNNGLPIIGVINRPFLEDENSRTIWGVSLPNCKLSTVSKLNNRKNVICISSSENQEIKNKFSGNGFQLVEASGAGHKILAVILGLADAYILTKGTTFKWDTCAPHAILKSIGGDILKFIGFAKKGNRDSLTYFIDDKSGNLDGIIAFRNREILNVVFDILNS